MAKIHRELNTLRITMQQERAIINALKREIKRMQGKEVIESGRLSDEERILDAFSSMPQDIRDARDMIRICQEELNKKRERLAELKEELDNRFRLTPYGIVKAIIRAKRRRKRVQYI